MAILVSWLFVVVVVIVVVVVVVLDLLGSGEFG